MFTAVADASQVAEARRLASDCARRTGVPQARIGDVAIVVTELATNLLKHARRRAHPRRASRRRRRRRAGSAGAGSRQRHGRRRALHGGRLLHGRQPGHRPRRDRAPGRRSCGSIPVPVWAPRSWSRFLSEAPAPTSARTQLGAALAPYPGERVCGDNWAFQRDRARPHHHGGRRRRAMVSRRRAPRTSPCGAFLENADAACEDMVERMHRALAADARRRSRGRADRCGRAHRALRRRRQHLRRCWSRPRAVAAHGVAQRHGRARRPAHPRVHLRFHRRPAGDPALRRD